MSNWNTIKSKKLYNIEYWSGGYFDINSNGEITVSPSQKQPSISLYKLAQDLKTRGFAFPIVVCFPGILHHRVATLRNAFKTAIQQENYQADYTAVYPIKVNQQYNVIKAILDSGQIGGLEAGSKSELIAVLSLASPDSIVICNGYKDREYIRLALIGQQMGIHTYLVIDKVPELKLILEESNKLGIKPRLGIRLRLSSISNGKWQHSGVVKSKFGLRPVEIIDIITSISEAGLINNLQLMHCHINSQISNIRDIQNGLREAGRYYSELRSLGVPINTIDVGGGLGIDYEGIHSCRPCSVNYSIQEYANNVIYEFKEICNKLNLPRPNIITETGRAVTAHHAVFITNIIDSEVLYKPSCPSPSTNDPEIIQDLWRQLNNVNQDSALEVYHNTAYWLNEIYLMFYQGIIDLKQRAHAEQLYYAVCKRVQALLQTNYQAREVFDELNETLPYKYCANFSLFQSTLDAWAINQIFPIMPLHRLNEYPDQRATLHDLTCDHDGHFKKYVTRDGINTSLPVHTLIEGQPYLMGAFLIGAYQETLSNFHNLYGKTNSVNIITSSDGSYKLIESIKGYNIQEMLQAVHFNPEQLLENYNNKLQNSTLSTEQKQLYLKEIKTSLGNYTYLGI